MTARAFALSLFFGALGLLSCDTAATPITSGARCVELSECPVIEDCNCGDGPQSYQVCRATRCAKSCAEACRALAQL